MLFRLFLIFSILPLVELAVLIKVGSLIGVLNTIIIVILTAVAGAYLVRLEGMSVLYRLQQSISRGLFPAEELIDGAMIFLAGGLLLTPGFFTDVAGLLILFPPSRGLFRRLIKKYIKQYINRNYFRDTF